MTYERLQRRIERLEAEERQRSFVKRNPTSATDRAVGEATRDPYVWVTQFTETYNPHWVEEGRSSPFEKFPSAEEYPHLPHVFEMLGSERIWFFEKSRDLMLTWACVAFLTNKAMIVLGREVLLQTQKLDKVKQLIKYARCLYDRQPQWLRDAFPLAKHQSDLALRFAHGGAVFGIAGGANQIRSYHPWGYLLDEAAFVPDAGDCYNEALSVVSGSIILNSSAGPGWFADVVHDVISNAEE